MLKSNDEALMADDKDLQLDFDIHPSVANNEQGRLFIRNLADKLNSKGWRPMRVSASLESDRIYFTLTQDDLKFLLTEVGDGKRAENG